jgi:hypothetical protein
VDQVADTSVLDDDGWALRYHLEDFLTRNFYLEEEYWRNGQHISFWTDWWLGEEPHCARFPRLFEFCFNPKIMIATHGSMMIKVSSLLNQRISYMSKSEMGHKLRPRLIRTMLNSGNLFGSSHVHLKCSSLYGD